MERMTRQEARLYIDYFGSPDRLATALGQQDLVLVGAPEIGWKIGRSEDASRIGQPSWRPLSGLPAGQGASPTVAPASAPAQ